MASPNHSPDADETSVVIPTSSYDTLGFCKDYVLRRHLHENEANIGSHEARVDWMRYIGPIDQFGGCNPFSGHFSSLVLPMCKPERLRIVSYILEYAFLYDNVLESAAKASLDKESDHLVLSETDYKTVRSVTGTKQIQSKMILDLLNLDRERAENVIDVWKTMVSTTAKRDKTKSFENLEEYVSYRIIDTGAPFVDAMMLFGMGLSLTKEERDLMEPIARPCFAALGLANDYVSFDVEYAEFKESGASTMTNAVWQYMQWEDIGVEEAKERVKQVTTHYEAEFLRLREEFIQSQRNRKSPHLETYLTALGYQIPGNFVWSLTCPRYHPANRYDANYGYEEYLEWRTNLLEVQPVLDHIHRLQKEENQRRALSPAVSDRLSRSSSESDLSTADISSTTTDNESSGLNSPISSTFSDSRKGSVVEALEEEVCRALNTEHVLAPFEYINSLPSKKVRDAFIDALNVWLAIQEGVTNRIKSIGNLLHNASLMLDDIEDSSDLRRGMPATHTVFGTPQTINSANFVIIQALDEVYKLDSPNSVSIFIEEMKNLHIGQSYDLYWTRSMECPSEEEYLEMVDNSKRLMYTIALKDVCLPTHSETGGLFRLLARLLLAHQTQLEQSELDNFVSLTGKYFQIRDDYENLASAEYTSQKGFCEDLDEGKYSYPLIHALKSNKNNLQLRAILHERRDGRGLSPEHKQLALKHLKETGSLEYTRKTMLSLQEQINVEIGGLEARIGSNNWVMRLLLHKLGI
ncbi:geranylgeranyl pyrophosphate synthase protein [Rutstroemia sp. NJR-2017a WRK4]|nr:geranylgeranyl pyrophosphate synthase protein [Rutstroemia sp. NJR-2017a WRK4]